MSSEKVWQVLDCGWQLIFTLNVISRLGSVLWHSSGTHLLLNRLLTVMVPPFGAGVEAKSVCSSLYEPVYSDICLRNCKYGIPSVIYLYGKRKEFKTLAGYPNSMGTWYCVKLVGKSKHLSFEGLSFQRMTKVIIPYNLCNRSWGRTHIRSNGA